MNGADYFRDKLLKEDLYVTNAKRYAEKIRNMDNVIIWGGYWKCSTNFIRFFEEYDILENLKYLADNQKDRWGTLVNGYKILSPEEVINQVKDKKIYIIIAGVHLTEIRQQLIDIGIDDSFIDITGYTVVNDYYTYKNETAYQIIYSHLDEFEKVFFFLADKRSKEIYLNILNSKISLDNKYLEGISSPSQEQYFDKELIELGKNEVFCDCGSYNGDTLETFLDLTNGSYKKYLAIEADKDTFDDLNEKIIDNSYKDIVTYNIACWNEKTVLKFQSEQSAGHITDHGDILVNADTLDHILEDEPITFLKMDIEGAEELALTGASQLIRKNKPILCICVYHNLKDYYKLPLIMKELNKDYNLFIRNYTEMAAIETVCYAIPKERLAINK